jgi:YidC/Oxa1 family membrane protein insertase
MTPVFANILQPLIDAADWLLLMLHDDIGLSWGLSIIGLTVIVRLALVPLTIKQIKSMNALRALQPQMKEIQEKYKGDRQAMNQAMMKFYQENKVNPFASCLPLILQLPVFMALFYLLGGDEFQQRVEDSGEQSFLFINDLAAKAHGSELVILMILFIGSQVASTMVMSVSVDKTQQRIMLLLPLFFAVLIPNFPAGLILYWITTNFWTLGQQLVVKRLAPPPQAVMPAMAKAARSNGKSQGKAEGKAEGKAGGKAKDQEKVSVGVGAGGNPKAPPPPPRKKKRRRR